MANKRLVVIESCCDCPNFNNSYDEYLETCDILKRKIKRKKKSMYLYIYPIPNDCPLEKVEKGK